MVKHWSPLYQSSYFKGQLTIFKGCACESSVNVTQRSHQFTEVKVARSLTQPYINVWQT